MATKFTYKMRSGGKGCGVGDPPCTYIIVKKTMWSNSQTIVGYSLWHNEKVWDVLAWAGVLPAPHLPHLLRGGVRGRPGPGTRQGEGHDAGDIQEGAHLLWHLCYRRASRVQRYTLYTILHTGTFCDRDCDSYMIFTVVKKCLLAVNAMARLPSSYSSVCTAKNQYRKFETNIPRKWIARPQSQFPNPNSCVCKRFIYSLHRCAYSAAGNMCTDPGNTVYKSLTDT